MGWSADKAAWCCAHQSDSWMGSKAAWCCEHHNLLCAGRAAPGVAIGKTLVPSNLQENFEVKPVRQRFPTGTQIASLLIGCSSLGIVFAAVRGLPSICRFSPRFSIFHSGRTVLSVDVEYVRASTD